MQHTVDHPDLYEAHRAAKAITRGGTQATDDVAMEAMWRALDSGKTKEEAEKVFFETYKKVKDGKEALLPIK